MEPSSFRSEMKREVGELRSWCYSCYDIDTLSKTNNTYSHLLGIHIYSTLTRTSTTASETQIVDARLTTTVIQSVIIARVVSIDAWRCYTMKQ